MAKILHTGHSEDGLMRGEGVFEILHSQEDLQGQLLRIEKAGRTCYRSERRDITPDSADKFIRMVLRRGHESVIEHSSLSVVFSNVSRGFTRECVRHRHTAFSQESTRYVDHDGGSIDLDKAELTIIVPPHGDLQSVTSVLPISISAAFGLSPRGDVDSAVAVLEEIYKNLRKDGWPPEDARQFLPIGIASKIVVTASFRQWRHIMSLRTQKAAHWEIRYMTYDLLTILKVIISVIFEDFTNLDEDGGLLKDKNGYGYYRKIVT